MDEQMLSGIAAIDLKIKKPTNVDPARSLSISLPPVAYMPSRHKDTTFYNLYEAYKRDGYFHRAVLRYVQLGFSSGFKLKVKNPRVGIYLEQRLQIAASLDNTTPTSFCKQAFRDFILFGNVFFIKAYSSKLPSLSNFKLAPKIPVGLFQVYPQSMTPIFDKTGNIIKWLYQDKNSAGVDVKQEFGVNDVIHLTYDKGANSLYGIPAFIAVVSDVMAERQIEDSILKLIYKYPNPLIHIETPPVGDKDGSTSEDMQRIAAMVRSMSSDSALITAPGQKVNLLGAESRALRMEQYMALFLKRIFSGLGMNAQMIGQDPSNQKDIELDRITRDQAEDFINQFKEQFKYHIIQLFLQDAGLNEDVDFETADTDPLYRIKIETHSSNMYNNNLMTENESRQAMGLAPLSPAEYANTNVNRVKLPQVMEPAKLQAQQASYVKRNTNAKKTRPSGASKPPSNQHT